MKLEKAIEINKAFLDGTYDPRALDLEHAIKLGAEALKAIEHQRSTYHYHVPKLLPGETED